MSRLRSPLPLLTVTVFAVAAFVVTSRGVVNPIGLTIGLSTMNADHDMAAMEERIKAKVLQSVMQDIERTLEQHGTPVAAKDQQSSASGLPSCAELMSRPGSKYRLGDFITRRTIPHKWTPRKDGSREFDLTTICTLKRYTADDARQCLANQHLNFIGDSVSRYQFHSLAHLIDKGTYPPRFPSPRAYGDECRYHIDEHNQSQCSPDGQPNICTEVDWFRHYQDRSWDMLYQALGGGSDGGIFDGRMECACARNDDERIETENMLYASKLDENGHRIVLSIMQERGWINNVLPIRGYGFTGCSFNESCRLTDAMQNTMYDRLRNESYDYSQSFPEAIDADNGVLRHVVPPVNIAIYNRGLWGKLAPERAQRIFPALFNWTGGTSGRCLFKSTTASGRDTDQHLLQHENQPSIRNEAVNAGCSFLDYGHITSDFANLYWAFPLPPGGGGIERTDVYWDAVHFQPWVYEELNNVLLNVLCNAK